MAEFLNRGELEAVLTLILRANVSGNEVDAVYLLKQRLTELIKEAPAPKSPPEKS